MADLARSNRWVEKHTADGVPYYFEPSSETVTWEKPDCLKSAAELETNSGPWAWVSDERILVTNFFLFVCFIAGFELVLVAFSASGS